MIEENGIIDQPNPTMKQRSLLNKYGVSIEHISFEYIEKCNDVKQLERIVRILRSGEEGYYPDLQKSAEDRLRALSPNNRQLRSEEPVLTRNSMNKEEWNNLMSDVSDWKKEISVRDLRLTEENNNTMDETTLPPIRQPPPTKSVQEKKSIDPAPCTNRVTDYTTWDKYDADTALLRMDLEEERKMEKKRHKQRLRAKETDRLELVVKEAEKLSETEKQVLAEEEKNRGNEYYQAKEFDEAIKYYTASIAIWPTAKAYNNRAASYLKQCKFSAALEDTNITLRMEPDNVKALFRRAVALQHKNMFREALADMDAVLKQQPRHVLAQHISNDLREQVNTLPRTVRVMTDEGLYKPKKIVEMNSADLTEDTLTGNTFEVNEFGLPCVMCTCNRPGSLQLGPRRTLRPPSSAPSIVELGDEAAPARTTHTKLQIIETDQPAEQFFKPKKSVVVDKRTQKTPGLTNGACLPVDDNELTNGGETNANGDSGMDEDFELTCPILDDPPQGALVQPSA